MLRLGRPSIPCLLALLLPTCSSPPVAPPPAPRHESVVLLHGLGRTASSMASMARFLRDEGYTVVNVDYPSRKLGVDELVQLLEQRLASEDLHDPVHFVGHSAGGILARAFLYQHPEFPVGRVVLLSPPSQGSELAAELRAWGLVRWLTGPFAGELAAGKGALPTVLPAPPYPLGVITGNRSVFLPLSAMIDGEDDGIVGVDEARTEGMADFLVVPRSHTWIMNSREVQARTLDFLQHGRFEPVPAGPDASKGADA